MTPLFAGELALITGAASGIGRGIARALAADGARLILVDIEAAALDALKLEIEAQGGVARTVVCDLALSVSSRIDHLLSDEVPAIFVHSASPRRHETQLPATVTEEQWRTMLAVNLDAGFLLGRAIANAMADREIRGRLLYITSLHADSPRNLAHYSAAKAGLTMVVKELARAYGAHGIRVNALAPGAIPGGGFAADVESLTKKIALGRTGTPADVAGAAVALLADRFCGYVTGITLVVDGGIALYNWIDAPA
jgi:NAD(P)-dependent dehydrogenase (short-subunit alcohol dehydrogenase family)